VGDRHAVRHFRDEDGDGHCAEVAPLVGRLPPSKQHRTRTILFDEVNGRLFVSVGSSCNLCREQDPERATILSFVATDPEDGHIYVTSDWISHLVIRITPPRLRTRWAHDLPHDAVLGQRISLRARVRVGGLDEAGEPPRVTADLSGWDGPRDLELLHRETRRYELAAEVTVEGSSGVRSIIARVEQDTPRGLLVAELRHPVEVLHGEDLRIIRDHLADSWFTDGRGAQLRAGSTADPVFEGDAAVQVSSTGFALLGWNLRLMTQEHLGIGEFESLHFALHPGHVEVREQSPRLVLIGNPGQGRSVDLLEEGLLDMHRPEWQVVELPLQRQWIGPDPLSALQLSGNLAGTFYLDDLRLTAAQGSVHSGRRRGDQRPARRSEPDPELSQSLQQRDRHFLPPSSISGGGADDLQCSRPEGGFAGVGSAGCRPTQCALGWARRGGYLSGQRCLPVPSPVCRLVTRKLLLLR